MNFSLFVANRLRKGPKNTFTGAIVRVAQLSIVLGLAIMLVSIAILEGYQQTIEEKVFGFDAHIHLQSYQSSSQTEPQPIARNLAKEKRWKALQGIRHVQAFGLKPALLKTKTTVQGILIKGFDSGWDTSTFRQNLVAGRFPKTTSYAEMQKDSSIEGYEILISTKIATLLDLKIGDDVVFYFLQNPPRFRKVIITGLYETNLEEFDTQFVIGDLALLCNLSGWGDSLVSGYQIFAKNPHEATFWANLINKDADYKWIALPITQVHPQLFEWLQLISRNVEVLIVLIVIVACFNICSTLLMMILERTRMIGLLKALGAMPSQIGGIFFYSGLNIILKAVFWGNLVGLTLCFVQAQFRIVPLDPVNYYMAYVPIAWNWLSIIQLNVVVLVTSVLALLLPGLAIGSVKIVKALRFS